MWSVTLGQALDPSEPRLPMVKWEEGPLSQDIWYRKERG